MKDSIFELKLKGYCCSQIIMELGLKHLNKENPDLVSAMGGLCDGLTFGKTCGVLSSAICLLYLVDPYEANQKHVRDLCEWFSDSFGATDCNDLLNGSPLAKVEKCPMFIESTFTKLCEMLEWDIDA